VLSSIIQKMPSRTLPLCSEGERRLEIAHELFTSMTLGCGRFCTRPAIVALVGDDAGEGFR